jgi:hypothetical protein
MTESKKMSEFNALDIVLDSHTIPVLDDGPSNTIATADSIRRNRAAQCSYLNGAFPEFENVKDALDYLLYTPLSANLTITSPNPTTILLGTTVESVSLSWTIEGGYSLTSQILNQGIGSISTDLRSYTQSNANLTQDTTYTLSVQDELSSDSGSASILFRNLYYIGGLSQPSSNQADIRALPSSFASGRNRSFVSNPAGNFICFAYPLRFGLASINVNGLLNTAFSIQTLSITNSAGFSENYYVYTSNTIQFGTGINITVN